MSDEYEVFFEEKEKGIRVKANNIDGAILFAVLEQYPLIETYFTRKKQSISKIKLWIPKVKGFWVEIPIEQWKGHLRHLITTFSWSNGNKQARFEDNKE